MMWWLLTEPPRFETSEGEARDRTGDDDLWFHIAKASKNIIVHHITVFFL